MFWKQATFVSFYNNLARSVNEPLSVVFMIVKHSII